MKKAILFSVIAAVVAMVGCTKENVLKNSTPKIFEGDQAYVNVVISEAGTIGTRADIDDSYFAYSTDEDAVTDAYFYFYDETGRFVSRASVWKDGEYKESTDPAIEYNSSTLVVLDNLSGSAYPTYLVTVLNKPSAFSYESTLEEMISALTYPDLSDTEGGIRNDDGNLVLSTSSFADQGYEDEDGNPLYFVTKLDESNFATSAEEAADADPVNIYVERVAAKVSVSVSEDMGNATELGDGSTGYALNVTVAGADNAGTDSGTETLYVKFLGWRLNATAKYSYMSKNISEDWTDTYLNFTPWNDPTNMRCYWGMSPNYGQDGDYPTTSGGVQDPTTDDPAETGGGQTLNEWLNYVSLVEVNDFEDDVEYCAENTNDVDHIGKSKNSSAITSVLLSAQICDADGNPAGDYVHFSGVLWEKDHYLAYAMQYVYSSAVGLNAWYIGEDDNFYQLDESYIELVTYNDGKVHVALTSEAAEGTYYEITGYTDDGKVDTYEEIEVSDIEDALGEFNDYADSQVSDDDGEDGYVVAYTDGLMYYNIPIQHFNNTYGEELAEANYGVVRNHWYQVTITSLSKLGRGIFDPNEVIIPDEDLESYYVNAEIHILPWKVVTFDADL